MLNTKHTTLLFCVLFHFFLFFFFNIQAKAINDPLDYWSSTKGPSPLWGLWRYCKGALKLFDSTFFNVLLSFYIYTAQHALQQTNNTEKPLNYAKTNWD